MPTMQQGSGRKTVVTEHLPECPVEKRLRAGRTVGSQTCICAALRACEERVFALHPEWTMTGLCKPDCAACRRLTQLITEWECGYEKGLDAAREAIAALGTEREIRSPSSLEIDIHAALAAIDALKEKQ